MAGGTGQGCGSEPRRRLPQPAQHAQRAGSGPVSGEVLLTVVPESHRGPGAAADMGQPDVGCRFEGPAWRLLACSPVIVEPGREWGCRDGASPGCAVSPPSLLTPRMLPFLPGGAGSWWALFPGGRGAELRPDLPTWPVTPAPTVAGPSGCCLPAELVFGASSPACSLSFPQRPHLCP